MRSEVLLVFIVVCCLLPVPSGAQNTAELSTTSSGIQNGPGQFRLFIPSPDSISSIQITDLINGQHGEVIVATANGLSTYNGSWITQHLNRANISAGLMDDFVTAVEYDNTGNLWIGFKSGIQIYNGVSYISIRDQQVLKDPRINVLQRWNSDMWVATGTAGIHRYRNGSWTWYQPFAPGGPGFYRVDSMVPDSTDDTLLIATDHEGLWRITIPNETVQFDEIQDKNGPFGLLEHVRRDPFGGAYFFNSSLVAHYDESSGFTTVLSGRVLEPPSIPINDLDKGSNGKLYLATNDGIFVWAGGAVSEHLGRFEGIGASPIVKTVKTDAYGRVWFSTAAVMGFYTGDASSSAPITVEIATLAINATAPAPNSTSATPSPGAVVTTQLPVPVVTAAPSRTLFDQIMDLISKLWPSFSGSR
jgi:hypothetical protein